MPGMGVNRMSRKDKLIRQWIASGDLPPEALPNGFVRAHELGRKTGSGGAGTGMALARGFPPEIDMGGPPAGASESVHGRVTQRAARRSSGALALLLGLGVVVWAVLAGAILYMKYLPG